jgi:hypothetical protein
MNTRERVKNAIGRFLTEMPPYWKEEQLERLIGDLESDECKKALKGLEDDGVIEIVGKPDCYFVITEEYLSSHLPDEFKTLGIAQVRKILSEK